jgi:hypothetical protein
MESIDDRASLRMGNLFDAITSASVVVVAADAVVAVTELVTVVVVVTGLVVVVVKVTGLAADDVDSGGAATSIMETSGAADAVISDDKDAVPGAATDAAPETVVAPKAAVGSDESDDFSSDRHSTIGVGPVDGYVEFAFALETDGESAKVDT